jgi:hypothetical protein
MTLSATAEHFSFDPTPADARSGRAAIVLAKAPARANEVRVTFNVDMTNAPSLLYRRPRFERWRIEHHGHAAVKCRRVIELIAGLYRSFGAL